MKRITQFVSVMAFAAMATLLPVATLSVSAAPTTFYVKYNTDLHQWRTQPEKWDEEYEGREVYYLNDGDNPVKDGDIVVVLDNDEHATGDPFTINAHVSNLTINRSHAVVTVGGADECYVFGDSFTAINGNITNGYVYDNAICTFNNNVDTLTITATQTNGIDAKVSVGGTVRHLIAQNASDVLYDYYDFAAGKLYFDENGHFNVDEAYYSKTPSAAPAAPAASPAKPAAPAASAPSSSSSGALDNVPKTGDSNVILWLFAVGATCFAGSLALKRKEQ